MSEKSEKIDELIDDFLMTNCLADKRESMTSLLKKVNAAGGYAEEYSEMSDDEIASELIHKLWADIDLFSRESALIFEVIERLRNEKTDD